MMRALVLGAMALAVSAAGALANGHGYRHHYGYGYAGPVFEYTGNAYDGYPGPSYSRTSYPIYAAVPAYAAPIVSTPAYGYGLGYWGRPPGYWGGYGYGWR